MAVSTDAVRVSAISAEPLDLDAHLRAVDDSRMGAVTTFVGRVRDHDPDAATAVVALEYSAHPEAEATLAEQDGQISRRQIALFRALAGGWST